MADEIKKIYDVSILGSDTVISDLERINKNFIEIKRNKQALQGIIATSSDAQEIARAKAEYEKLRVETARVNLENKKLLGVSRDLTNQSKIFTLEKKKSANALQVEAESVVGLRQKYNEYRNTVDRTLDRNSQAFRDANSELIKMKRELDDISRTRTRDGLLVGEYTSGILQAFRSNGLDTIIGNQVDKVKGKVNELDAEFEQLKQELSDVGVKGDGAFERIERKMLENRKAAEQLKGELHRVKSEMTGVGSVGNQISASISKGFKNVKRDLVGFTLGYIGFQAALQKGQQEVSRSLELAEKTEGVRNAFKKLDDPNMLDNLRKATKGTVSDLDLMKATVQANNFQIPIENLANYFEFAKRRAQDTGESVDYLVNSIILGIGRKSPLILDNLGISAVRLRQNLKGVSAQAADIGDVAKVVSKIIAEENAKVGASTNKVSTQVQKNRAQWENFRVEVGEKLLPLFANMSGFLLSIVSLLANIPFGVVVGGLTLLTSALALYYAEQVRSYIITQKANKESIISALLSKAEAAQKLILTGATKAQALATKVATYELKLFNGAIRISPLGWLLSILLLVVPAIIGMSKAYGKATGAIKSSSSAQKDLNEALKIGIKNSAKEVTELDRLYAIATDVRIATDERKKAVDRLQELYPAYFGNLRDEIILNGQAEKQYYAVRDAIIAKANASAIEAKLEERAAERLNNSIGLLEQQQKLRDYLSKKGVSISKANQGAKQFGLTFEGTDYVANYPKRNSNFSAADEQVTDRYIRQYIRNAEEIRKTKKEEAEKDKALQVELIRNQQASSKLTGQDNASSITPIKTGKKGSVSSKSSQKSESRISKLKEQYDQELKLLERSYNDQEITEEEYLKAQLAIYDEYRQSKLLAIQNLNADEQKQSVDFENELAANQKQNRDKLLEIEIEAMEARNRDLQKGFQDGFEIEKRQYEDRLKVIKDGEQAIQDALERNKVAILTSNELTPEEKQKRIAEQERLSMLLLYSYRLDNNQKTKDLYDDMLKHKIITEEEYDQFIHDLEAQRLEDLASQNDAEVEATREKVEKQKKLEEERAERIKQLQAEVRNLAMQAISEIGNAEKERIQEAVQYNQDKTQSNFDSIKERRLAEAENQTDILLIDQEFRRKQEKLDRQFAERKRAAALKQIEIDFAMATLKALLLLPNFIAAGAAEVSALLTYGIARNRIKKQRFAHGGILRSGGVFRGPSHRYGGIPIYDKEVEGGEGYVINKKSIADSNIYTASGTPAQIASAVNILKGGANFAPGGEIYGSSLQPPVFPSYTNSSLGASASLDLSKLEAMVEQLTTVVYAESSKPVVLSTEKVRNENRDNDRRNHITTI